jgi:hypothetical protein
MIECHLAGISSAGSSREAFYSIFFRDLIGIVKINCNYSGIFLVPPAAAGERKGLCEDTSRSGQGTASPGTPAEGLQ